MPSKPTSKNKEPNTNKVEQIINHLSRYNGTSLQKLVKTTSWQPYSLRGFISGSLKKHGLIVMSTKQEPKPPRLFVDQMPVGIIYSPMMF